MDFLCFSEKEVMISLNGINQLIFVTVKFCFLFEARTEFLDVIYIIFGPPSC
jgi:hypothetical protein